MHGVFLSVVGSGLWRLNPSRAVQPAKRSRVLWKMADVPRSDIRIQNSYSNNYKNGSYMLIFLYPKFNTLND